MLSITTDYVQGTGSPEPYLRRIAAAGFSHVHWCHQWNTDFVYSDPEIDQIATWMCDYGLQLCDLHASAGIEKGWISPQEYEGLAGVELVKNRIKLAARLSGDVIIMHARDAPAEPVAEQVYYTQLFKSLDALEPYARAHGVRIALENLNPDNFGTLEKILSRYGPDFLGICYDSGHGNIAGNGLDHLDRLKARLISVHLNDNDARGDQHKLLFSGTVDWDRLARIMAASAYTKMPSMEIVINHFDSRDEQAFLKTGFETGMAFSQMIEGYK